MSSTPTHVAPGDEPDRAAARRLAEPHAAQRARRVRHMRKRLVAGSVAIFTAAWAAVFLQLVSGHDPALGKNAGEQQGGAAATSSPSGDAWSDSSSSASSSPTPVVTQQS